MNFQGCIPRARSWNRWHSCQTIRRMCIMGRGSYTCRLRHRRGCCWRKQRTPFEALSWRQFYGYRFIPFPTFLLFGFYLYFSLASESSWTRANSRPRTRLLRCSVYRMIWALGSVSYHEVRKFPQLMNSLRVVEVDEPWMCNPQLLKFVTFLCAFVENTIKCFAATSTGYAVQNVQKSKPRTIHEKRTYFTKIAASPLVWYRYLPYPYGRDVT